PPVGTYRRRARGAERTASDSMMSAPTHFSAPCWERIAPLLRRPVGRRPHSVRRFYASFRYRAQSWNRERRVVVKVEWHPGELYPRVGFIVTNLHRPAKKVVACRFRRSRTARPTEGEHLIRAKPNTSSERRRAARPEPRDRG